MFNEKDALKLSQKPNVTSQEIVMLKIKSANENVCAKHYANKLSKNI